jgi:sugar phosphate isomerase/epimerase
MEKISNAKEYSPDQARRGNLRQRLITRAIARHAAGDSHLIPALAHLPTPVPSMSTRLRHVRFVLCLAACAGVPRTPAAPPIPEEYRVGGFAIGPQVYSFRFFTLFEAIEKSAQTGGKSIELGMNLKVSAEHPVAFNHNVPEALVPLVQAKLRQHGVKAVNYGVVPIPTDEAAARKVFEFARKMELNAIITESIGSLDVIEKFVREFDLKVGIHQHARKPNDPNYKIWDPAFVRELVANRDSRIGACADTGHWQTSGIRAIDGVKLLAGRLISLHLKERAALGPGHHDEIFGTGVTDIPAILAELRRQKFDGNIAIEYEYNWQNSVPDIAQCIGFVRGWAAAHPQ